MMQLQSYAEGAWITGSGNARPIFHAVTGEKLGDVSSEGLDFKNMHSYARRRGGPALRGMTFHERGRILKELALHLSKHKKELYQLCPASGATRSDAWFDIDGGIGTLFVYASKGRRDFPNETFYLDGVAEQLSKGNTFVGRHLCVPLRGVAL
ncbi:MAG: aldehyde dehydrogenase family protein, partial [Bdellovibrionales bacterium]|nr:aldehyde dehydrogenase family protein [Bdellovibrionales bacterium]